MSKVKCSSRNPAKCRYHGHDGQVTVLKAQIEKAGNAGDYLGYYVARETLDALEKRKSLMDSLTNAIETAKDNGDLKSIASLKASFKDVSGDDYNESSEVSLDKKVVSPRFMQGSNGELYFSSSNKKISNGQEHPDRIFFTDINGDKEAYVKADIYDHVEQGYPDDFRISANRPLSNEEMEKLAGLTGYHYRSTMNGEPLSDPQSDGGASIILGTDMTKASGRKTQLSPFIDGLPYIWRNGSPVRKTNRSGIGTEGTRLVDGFSDDKDNDLTFTLYLRENNVSFK